MSFLDDIETIEFDTGDGYIDEITTYKDGTQSVLRAYTPNGWNPIEEDER